VTLIYIHGVKVRSPEPGQALEKPFRRWVLPKIGQNAAYVPVYWGDLAADFRWNLASRPSTKLLHAGADDFAGLGSLRSTGTSTMLEKFLAAPRAPVAGPVLGATPVADPGSAPPLSTMRAEQRADFLADLYLAARERDPKVKAGEDLLIAQPHLAALADAAAEAADAWNELADGTTDDAELATRLIRAMDERLSGTQGLIHQGGLQDWMTGLGELLGRAATLPGDAVSTVFAEARPILNEFIANFLGDVLIYLTCRRDDQDNPGPIPQRVLAALRDAHRCKQATGEKIVVLTHSMGGQLLYDTINTFATNDPELCNLEIDHWITCGSQVSFFAELGVLLGQPNTRAPAKLPRPQRVKAWTNFYDTHDFVGFIMEPIFDGVHDLEYDTGYGLFLAHTGFLGRPSFFSAVARQL
jgi:hypothetical protein